MWTIQLYFYKNLFGEKAESKILEHKQLTKNTIKVLLHKIFSLDIERNKKIMEDFIRQNTIKFG